MIKTILIDDEPLAREIVKEYLDDYPEINVIAEGGDGFEGIKLIQEHKPELLFLDVQMPKINGFEMLELVEDKPAVIFTTAFDEFAIKAFESHAVDYLLKPFTRDRFKKAIEKWMTLRSTLNATKRVKNLIEDASIGMEQQDRIVIKDGHRIKIIPVTEVWYLEAYDDYVKIHTPEGVFLKNKTMTYFEQSLSSSLFTRIHRSYIVQLSQITRLDPYERDSHMAVLRSGVNLPVSKSGYVRLKAVLGI